MSDILNSEIISNAYTSISETYDRRYEINPLNGVAEALRGVVRQTGARRVLEVGCGTGYWLKTLCPHLDWIIGLDLSIAMLHKALQPPGSYDLVCASATSLPFAQCSFDLVFVVNAMHLFEDKRGFVEQIRHLVRPGGALVIIGLDVASAIGHWVMYDYFPGALEFDQSRFPPWEHIDLWMTEAGLAVQSLRTVEQIRSEKRGRAILDDHFIQRHSASHFLGLTDAQYQAGIDRIKLAIAQAEARGEEAVFKSEFELKMMVGLAHGR